MAQIIVTSNADSGAGSLRQAITAAQSDDTIIFDSSLEIDGVITIALETPLAFQYKNLTIDGGGHTGSGDALTTRVVLDIQELSRIVVLQNGTTGLSLKDITLLNGKSAAQGASAAVGYGSNSFEYCVFRNGTSSTYPAGGVACVNASINSFVDCLFKNCVSNNIGGGLYSTATSQNSLTNCTFAACSANYGGGLYSTATSQNSLTGCTFAACSANYGGGLYVSDTSQNTLTNCVFIPPENNTRTTIHNVGTNTDGSLIINGIICDLVQFVSNSTTVINGKLTAGTLTTGNSTLITFSGVDSILAVTTTATIGTATFTAAEGATGYIALPAGTATPTVGANIVVGEYGADVSSISATISEDVATIDVSAGDPSKTYIVEASSDGGETWTQIALVDKKTTLASAKAYIFRTFDGHFVTSSTIPRVYYYNGSPTAGSFAAASDWALDEGRTIVCSDAPTIKNGTFYCV